MTNIENLDFEEMIKVFQNALNEYLFIFQKSLLDIFASFKICVSGRNSFQFEYYCLDTNYSDEDNKKALEFFDMYVNIMSSYLDTLSKKYYKIRYYISKPSISNSKIGQSFYCEDLPFDFDKRIFREYNGREVIIDK